MQLHQAPPIPHVYVGGQVLVPPIYLPVIIPTNPLLSSPPSTNPTRKYSRLQWTSFVATCSM